MKRKNSKPATANGSQLSASEAAERSEACRMAFSDPDFDAFWEKVLASAREFRATKQRRKTRASGSAN